MNFFAAHAWLTTGVARDVLFEVTDGRFAVVAPDSAPGDARRLPGIVLPGLANAHSHAFHRALRGTTHGGTGSFWTWRTQMYAIAEALDPDSYLLLARATYAEMALAGITTVGEFHYLRHAPDGHPYAEPNAMAEALRQAAVEAGIRLTLLDTCYLRGGLTAAGHQPLEGPQLRFGDADAERWAERAGQLRPSEGMRIGAAIHSVRAVDSDSLDVVRQAATGRPLHVHLSEQTAENEACQQFYGRSPTELLADHGVLGSLTTAVHATHLSDADRSLLGDATTTVCMCPTTERDLADGIGSARALADAGCPLTLGTDQHAVIDLFEEARALELDERLASRQRGRFAPAELMAAMVGHASLGWPEVGRLEVGAVADLIAVRTDSVRTVGAAPDQLIFAATAADVDTVVVGGRVVVDGGRHQLGDVGQLLRRALRSSAFTAP